MNLLVIRIAVVLSLALHADGQQENALQVLEEALLLAEPQGVLRCFLNEMPALNSLLEKTVDHGATANYAGRILSETQSLQNPQVHRHHSPAQQGLFEPLTDRELEVLRLLAAGRSNSEIAAELFLAIGTVKKHINNIFGKMGVASRTQALLRAGELHIL